MSRYRAPAPLSERTFTCDSCQAVQPRDKAVYSLDGALCCTRCADRDKVSQYEREATQERIKLANKVVNLVDQVVAEVERLFLPLGFIGAVLVVMYFLLRLRDNL